MDIEKKYPLFCYANRLILKGEIFAAEVDEKGKIIQDSDGTVIPTRGAHISLLLDESYGDANVEEYWKSIQDDEDLKKK